MISSIRGRVTQSQSGLSLYVFYQSIFHDIKFGKIEIMLFGQIIGVLLPVVVFLAFYLRRRDVYDLHHAILGTLFLPHLYNGDMERCLNDRQAHIVFFFISNLNKTDVSAYINT